MPTLPDRPGQGRVLDPTGREVEHRVRGAVVDRHLELEPRDAQDGERARRFHLQRDLVGLHPACDQSFMSTFPLQVSSRGGGGGGAGGAGAGAAAAVSAAARLLAGGVSAPRPHDSSVAARTSTRPKTGRARFERDG